MTTAGTASERGVEPGPRQPTLTEAVLSVVVLIVLIATTIVLFGTAATDGPLQVALFTSAVIAGLMALRTGPRT
jgi:Na+:H+ antiporter, NhaC family